MASPAQAVREGGLAGFGDRTEGEDAARTDDSTRMQDLATEGLERHGQHHPLERVPQETFADAVFRIGEDGLRVGSEEECAHAGYPHPVLPVTGSAESGHRALWMAPDLDSGRVELRHVGMARAGRGECEFGHEHFLIVGAL